MRRGRICSTIALSARPAIPPAIAACALSDWRLATRRRRSYLPHLNALAAKPYSAEDTTMFKGSLVALITRLTEPVEC